MTLMRTVISNYGIIQAADSNLSDDDGPAGTGQKVFRLGFTDAALSLAGAYSVKGVRMDQWMPDFISTYGGTDEPSLSGFAKALSRKLEQEIGANGLFLCHIAGYVEDDDGAHPEMWFVRNFADIHPKTGDYIGVGLWQDPREDFWHRDFPNERQLFAKGGYHWYINGTTPGRQAHNIISPWLQEILQQIWQNPDWDFREPRDLQGMAAMVDAEMHLIGALYANSFDSTPYVGGPTQFVTLPPPANAVSL